MPDFTGMVALADTLGYTRAQREGKETVVAIEGDTGLLVHFLGVDGAGCGSVLSAQGGWGLADVIEEPSPTGVKKRPGPSRWEELELQVALPVADPLADWIAAAWRGEVQAKSVGITTMFQATDGKMNVLHRREFRNVLLTETTISILTGMPTGGGWMTLRLLPQTAWTTASFSGMVSTTTIPSPRPPLASSGLLLPGLDCRNIRQIEPFTVRQAFGSAIPPSPGSGVWLEPGPLSFPNLTVELHRTAAGDWQQWFHNFVVKGYNDATNEKTGTFALTDQHGRAMRIDLFNVGIFQLKGPMEISIPGGSLIKVVAGLYCQRMDFFR
jgi:hypothetical protein